MIKVNVWDNVSSLLSIGIRWFFFQSKVEKSNFGRMKFQVVSSHVAHWKILLNFDKSHVLLEIPKDENNSESRCLRRCISFIVRRNLTILLKLKVGVSNFKAVKFHIIWTPVDYRNLLSNFDKKFVSPQIFISGQNDESPCLKRCIWSIVYRNASILLEVESREVEL